MGIAPAHQPPVAEPAVAADEEFHIRPLPTQACHQEFEDRRRVVLGPDVRRPQIGHEQARPAGDVQRQEAVVVVVTVEEVLLLVAVDRVVGGVDVEGEFGGRRLERREELVDQDGRDADEVGAGDAVLEPAERGGRGEFGGAVDFGVVGRGLPERIAPEELVVVEVLVAGGEPEDPLGQERPLRVDDAFGRAGIGDGRVERRREADAAVGLTQQQQAGIGRDVAGGELGDEFPAADPGKRDGRCGTVCHRGGCRRGMEVVW